MSNFHGKEYKIVAGFRLVCSTEKKFGQQTKPYFLIWFPPLNNFQIKNSVLGKKFKFVATN